MENDYPLATEPASPQSGLAVMNKELEALLGNDEGRLMSLEDIRTGLFLCDEMIEGLTAGREILEKDPNYGPVLLSLKSYKRGLLEKTRQVEQVVIGLNKYMMKLMGK